MTFKESTDQLFKRLDHSDLAKALGVSVASIRQARLQPKAKAHREPPDQWKRAVLSLAEQQLAHYQRLIKQLKD